MSIDEQKEQAAYDATANLSTILRPTERLRACKNVIELAAKIAGYEIHYDENKSD